jgi:Protein of unknown function (DUF2795)
MQTYISKVIKIKNEHLKEILVGAEYPLTKGELIELAQLNYADEDLLHALYTLGDSNYYSLADIQQEIQQLLHEGRIIINENFAFEAQSQDDQDDYEDEDSEDLLTYERIDRYTLANL